MKELTKKQQQTVDYIRQFTKENQYPPTNAEIAKHFGCTVNNTFEQLRSLQKKGAIIITPRLARGIRIAEDQS